MRFLLVVAASFLGLMGCDSALQSEDPLFTASGDLPKNGLWAVYDANECAIPPKFERKPWPDCVTALRVAGDRWAVPGSSLPVGGRFLISEGSPTVIQLSAEPIPGGSADEDTYSYAAIAPTGPSPYVSARIWWGGCPDPETKPTTQRENDSADCVARTAEEVRGRLAKLTTQPGLSAVWVAP